MKTERELFEDSFKLKWEIGHAILKMVKFVDELATEKLKDLLLKICNANVICTKSDIEYIKDISEMICFKGLDYTTNFLNENTIHNSSIMA